MRAIFQLTHFGSYGIECPEIMPHHLIMPCTSRKKRFNRSIGALRSEQKFMHRFRKMIEESKDAVVSLRVWNETQHRKFQEPAKGKGNTERCCGGLATWSIRSTSTAQVVNIITAERRQRGRGYAERFVRWRIPDRGEERKNRPSPSWAHKMHILWTSVEQS